MTRRRLLCTGLLIMAMAACRPAPPSLSGTADSPEALAREVLGRIGARDQGGLKALALTADEFESVVYPQLPASRPERNTSAAFVWGRLSQQSDLSLAATLARHGGRAYVLQAIEFEGERTDYEGFSVRREVVLVVRTPEGGVERIRMFGSLISTTDGRHKVFSYVVD